jgi:hypothetical protein
MLRRILDSRHHSANRSRFDFGISANCGTQIVNVEDVERFVMQAAIFQQIRRQGVRLLTMMRDP